MAVNASNARMGGGAWEEGIQATQHLDLGVGRPSTGM